MLTTSNALVSTKKNIWRINLFVFMIKTSADFGKSKNCSVVLCKHILVYWETFITFLCWKEEKNHKKDIFCKFLVTNFCFHSPYCVFIQRKLLPKKIIISRNTKEREIHFWTSCYLPSCWIFKRVVGLFCLYCPFLKNS